MKMSVYIPDELWATVQAAEPEFKLSSFVQQALSDRFQPAAVRPYAVLSDMQRRNVGRARRQVLAQQTMAYQSGYDVGVMFAEQLPWRAFTDLVASGWDVQDWRDGFDDAAYEIVDRGGGLWSDDADHITWNDVMSIATEDFWEVSKDDREILTGVPAEGFWDAIRDLWENRALPASDDETAVNDAETPSDVENLEEGVS